MIHSYPILIKEGHLDTFGHVNNATYLALFEEARWDWISNRGYGLQKVRETGLGPTILEIHIRFLKELRLRQKIMIETKMASYEKKIGVIEQEMKNEAEDVCCHARFTMGLFDTRERKLVPPTAEWLKALGF